MTHALASEPLDVRAAMQRLAAANRVLERTADAYAHHPDPSRLADREDARWEHKRAVGHYLAVTSSYGLTVS